jgi:predicted Zn-dependent peptidase
MKTKKAAIKIKTINGYSVVCVPTASSISIVRAVVHSGFIYETKENLGIYHLLEHVLVDAWNRCKKNCILYWDKRGGLLNASTEETTMNYYVKGLPDTIEDMIEYIASITTNATLYDSVIESEKKAVLSELTNENSNPQTTLIHAFNQSFYVPEGLRLSSDISTQIKNLSTLTKRDLYDMYHKVFTPANILFVVYGNFSYEKIHRCFSKHLIQHPSVELPLLPCFSYSHQFLYVPKKIKNINLVMGFPLQRMLSCSELFSIIMTNVLFFELRSRHNLIYSVYCYVTTNHCNSVFFIEIDCIPANFKRIIEVIVRTLQHYQDHPLSEEILHGSKRKLLYAYHTSYEYDIYYASYIYDKKSILTKQQLMKRISTFSGTQFKSIMNKDILLDKCTLVYQGPKDLHLTWKSFL